jgi:hypothetical protein
MASKNMMNHYRQPIRRFAINLLLTLDLCQRSDRRGRPR